MTKKDLDEVINKARVEGKTDLLNQIDLLLEDLEKRVDFFYEDSKDLANKTYERGYFDGIHNIREKLKPLVAKYNNLTRVQIEEMTEDETKSDFIDKVLFDVLGWNPNLIKRNRSIITESNKKRPDYWYPQDPNIKIIVEAKRLGLDEDIEKGKYDKQVQEYAYHKAVNWAVLTNFKRFRIWYVTRSKIERFCDIDLIDGNLEHNLNQLKWFQNDNLIGQGLENEAKSRGFKIEAIDISTDFSVGLNSARKILNEYIKTNYKEKTYQDADELTQEIINRLIFIKKVEGNKIITNKLEQIYRNYNSETYEYIKKLFAEYRKLIDTDIFGQPDSEPEAEKIRIRSDIIKSLLDTISQAPNGFEYKYEHIGVDLLGSIYENYLAYIQKGVKLKGGKSERKKYGIYYTPKYIVDFITGSVLKYRKDLSNIKILDPSCGSGSFLISFMSRLNNFYKKEIKNYERITPSKKLDYLKNNLFGVDIDRRAIQIAKLNIYLELLTLSPGYKINEQNAQLMPSLNENLKQGNSLVDAKEISEDYFDWINKFKFLSKNNGFDIIVGNPPWVSIKGKYKSIDLSEKQLKYLLDKYPADKYRPNLFEIFIWRSLSLLKENGLFSFVVPDRICYNEQFINLRKTILENYELKRLWFRPEFKGKISDDVIFVIKKTKPSNASKVEIAEYPSQDFIKIPQKVYSQVSDYSWFVVSKKALDVLDIIRKNPEVKQLAELFKSSVGFIAKPNTVTEKKENDEQIKVLKGEDISKYAIKKYHYFKFSKENLIGGTSDIRKLGIKRKIFLRKTGNVLTAVFDDSGVYPEQSLYIIYSNYTNNGIEEDMKILCLLLNSALLNFYYNNFGITNRDSTPQLKKMDLDKFPIIIPKDQQNRSILLSLFDELETLNKKSNYLQVRNQSRQDEINREILKLEEELNSMIFKIYGVNTFFE